MVFLTQSAPMPPPEHQKVASRLTAQFQNAIEKEGCSFSVYQPIDYKIAEDTILNPDLLIVCKPITKQFLDFAPELVVEILSPATALKDRHTKFEIYQQQQILYYILVDVDTKKNRSLAVKRNGKIRRGVNRQKKAAAICV